MIGGKEMNYQMIAVQELENAAVSHLESLGIRATRQKAGVLEFHASLSPQRVESDIRGRIPHAEITIEADGNGSKGTVKVADVKSFDE